MQTTPDTASQPAARTLAAPATPSGAAVALAELAALSLDPADIGWRADAPGDPARQLALIVDWVRAWQRTDGNREAMARRGFRFPPVDPDCDPDQDWLVFARWMAGQPLEWRYEQEFGPLPPADALDEEDLAAQLETATARLATRGIELALADRLPDRARYTWLRQELQARPLPFLAPHTTLVVDGCGGDCDDCFQRESCDLAAEFDET